MGVELALADLVGGGLPLQPPDLLLQLVDVLLWVKDKLWPHEYRQIDLFVIGQVQDLDFLIEIIRMADQFSLALTEIVA